MGYTHYWQVHPENFRVDCAVKDLERLLENNSKIDGGSLSHDHIRIEGGCETFNISIHTEYRQYIEGYGFGFCKTKKLAYDDVVMKALLILKHYNGENIVVGSDGSRKEWEDALKWFSKEYPESSEPEIEYCPDCGYNE